MIKLAPRPTLRTANPVLLAATALALVGACSSGPEQGSGEGGAAGTASAGKGGTSVAGSTGAAGTSAGTGGTGPAGTNGAAGSAAAGSTGAAGTGPAGSPGIAGSGPGGGGAGGAATAGKGGAAGSPAGSAGSGVAGAGAAGTTGAAGSAGGSGGSTGNNTFFTDWPSGKSPQEIARRLITNYLGRSLNLQAEMHYAEVCTWYGALTASKLIPEATMNMNLIKRFDPFLTSAGDNAVPSRAHVDDRIWGIVPLEIYIQNMDAKYLALGKAMADKQWMTTTSDGITTEARYWVDDMYMILALQVQTYRATNDVKYLDRAATTAVAYLDKLQQSNGLFFHTSTSPRFWGRGNGWFAAGMTELLRTLPENHPKRARILMGFTKMMAGLLSFQASTGMWKQLVDNTSTGNWAESSGTAMFTFGMVTGVKNGWLPAETYGPAARKAWLAMIDYINTSGDVREVCAGTGEAATSGGGTSQATQEKYYLDRPRIVGDFHGQAPYLWTASALMR